MQRGAEVCTLLHSTACPFIPPQEPERAEAPLHDELERFQQAFGAIEKGMTLLAKDFRGELVPQDPNDEPADVMPLVSAVTPPPSLLEHALAARKPLPNEVPAQRLYTYCIYELRFSEDEAYRRVTAARLVRRFPALLDAIASGELHLTGLVMLGPHLTEANLLEVLARAKHRTKKELARLVRELNPLPDVPPLIEPLGPAISSSAAPKPSSKGDPVSAVAPKDPTWEEYTQSFCPVRNLLPGDRPRDWMGAVGEAVLGAEPALGAGALAQEALPVLEEPTPAPLEPQRYRVQFTASEEYVKLIEEAKALLSHETPARALDELHLSAMRAFVSELKKQKHAVVARPQSRKSRRQRTRAQTECSRASAETRNRVCTSEGVGVSPHPSAERCSHATRGDARTSTTPASAAARLTGSNTTTSNPSRWADPIAHAMSPCAATRTIISLPSETSVASSWNGSAARVATRSFARKSSRNERTLAPRAPAANFYPCHVIKRAGEAVPSVFVAMLITELRRAVFFRASSGAARHRQGGTRC